jgi:hypothetical protein
VTVEVSTLFTDVAVIVGACIAEGIKYMLDCKKWRMIQANKNIICLRKENFVFSSNFLK